MQRTVPVIPVGFFAIVIGLVSLGDCWRVASLAWQTPFVISDVIMMIATGVWLVLISLYAAKWILHDELARAEYDDPIQSCLIALVPVSTLLIAYVADEWSHDVAVALFTVAIVAAVAYGARFASWLIRGGHDVHSITPAVYLPTVASNLAGAFAAATLGFQELAELLIGVGVFLWLMLESQIGFRLSRYQSLPPAQRPLIGILLAPPAVAALAYLAITGGAAGPPADLFTHALIGYGLFIALVIARDLRWLLAGPFTPSWWAFSFGVGALATDIELVYVRAKGGSFDWLAVAAMVVATVVIGALAIRTPVPVLSGLSRAKRTPR